MQAQNWKCCNIKLWRIIKELSVSRAFNIICILVYFGLYIMTINITWRIIRKSCIWSLHLRNFFCLQVLHYCFKNVAGCNVIFKISYIYLKLKLGTEKHIRLKWVFLPQWACSKLINYKAGNSNLTYCLRLRWLHDCLSDVTVAVTSLWHWSHSLLLLHRECEILWEVSLFIR